MREIKRLIFHHSASPLTTTVADIRRWHVEENGWSDIAYHYVILRFGIVAAGRPIHLTGAHARGANGDSVGICIVGDNTDPENKWTQEQIGAALRLLGAWRQIVPAIPIIGHRDVGSTECPGCDIREVLGERK